MPLSANITEAANPSLFSTTPEPVPSREAYSVRQSFLLPPMLMAGRASALGSAGDLGESGAVNRYVVAGMVWLTAATVRGPRPMRVFPPVY